MELKPIKARFALLFVAEVIAIVSPKGGVGKTTIAANLGIALARIGKRVLLIDTNPHTPNLSLYLGLLRTPYTLRDLIVEKLLPPEVTYVVEEDLHLMPSPVFGAEELENLNEKKLKSLLKRLRPNYDFIILDSPPGVDDYIKMLMKASDSALLIVTPDLPTLATSKKIAYMSTETRTAVNVVVNKATGSRHEVTKNEIEGFLGLPVYAVIPYDKTVIKAVQMLKPVINFNCPASRAIKRLAYRVAGLPYQESLFEKISKLLRKLFLFR